MKLGNVATSAAPLVNEKHSDSASHLVFKVITTRAYNALTDEQDDILNMTDTELGTYLKTVLETVMVSLDSGIVNGRNIIMNLNLFEIALAAIANKIPITTEESASNTLNINVPLALSVDGGFVPFSISNTLNVNVTCSTTHNCQVYILNNSNYQTSQISKVQKETILAGQVTNAKLNNVAIIIPDLRNVDLNYRNGVINSYLSEELDILNNMNGLVGAVVKNVCFSTFANAYAFKTDLRNNPDLTSIRFHSENSNEFYYSITPENINF